MYSLKKILHVLKLFMVGKEIFGNTDTLNINKMLVIHVMSFNDVLLGFLVFFWLVDI